ncbi:MULTISPECIES: SH3 domain-containing protein [Limnospira]|uniref:SH3 type 3 domain protein n=1 Tax=Limnospira maxima CS-328 TaxID=513049 RepID=B5W8S3_LIMMA|nr:SH3 domain-containing protein [Limnospira maxima]EKD09405.1 SH3 type 3 domain protein [Arthrospira platensis C1]MBD2708750.1 SH3 domain-containing protein [Arthrospira platensis FACHB-835]MDC0839430.1 SH3 domain-containing protein [Limnoraphis robusta]EDZ92079.1 SH3 type 3 domain protein [Limnospira maxima CS-328]UWU46370.1 SH3 domain-containing protein [Arthrospira platensis C1]
MIQQAIVTTSGDVLNVRSSPYGPVIDTVEPGTVVEVIGTPVRQGGLTWVPIGGDRWVSREFLTVHNPTTETDDHLANTIGGPKIVATQTQETIAGGLKVYHTELFDAGGWLVNTVRCISGRIGQQTPSDQPGSQTPIPFGVYTFDIPGSVEYAGGEFGGVWSAVTPTFETDRGGFGVHYDPSVFKDNEETGTAGCLATPTIEERDLMTDFIRTHAPTHLIIQPQLIDNGPITDPSERQSSGPVGVPED